MFQALALCMLISKTRLCPCTMQKGVPVSSSHLRYADGAIGGVYY